MRPAYAQAVCDQYKGNAFDLAKKSMSSELAAFLQEQKYNFPERGADEVKKLETS